MNVFCEAVKIMNFIISSPLRTHLFNNLYDVMGSTYNVLCWVLRREAQWLCWFEKLLLRVFQLRAELATFFLEHHFCLKE